MKKRRILILCVIVLLLAACALGIYVLRQRGQGSAGGDNVCYTQAVSEILGYGDDFGAGNRYTGVVEAERSENINADSNRKVKEILVQEGDLVEEGTPLFTYDVEEEELALEQSRLELEKLDNSLSTLRDEIKELEAERKKAASADKLEYTMQIQSKELDVKQTEYDIQVKQSEIAQKERELENTTVVSPMAGIVQSINDGDQQTDYMYGGEDSAFMKLLSTGMFRVKCKASEQNIWEIAQDTPVIVRSRISEDTWSGRVSEIITSDTENNDDNGYYYYADDTASQYAFYVELSSSDGLMMGQHVYVEMDLGQSEPKSGIWLPSGYLIMEEDGMYVLAENGGGKIEKRPVTTGVYDEAMDQYEILEGLTEEDWIAYPAEDTAPGQKSIRQTRYQENIQ